MSNRPEAFLRKAQEEPPNHPKGNCQYCGEKLTGRKRKWCCELHAWEYRKKYTDHVVYWAEFRDEIVKRDEYLCKKCGRGYDDFGDPEWETLEVHHIIPFIKGGNFFDEANCITLCSSCHKKRHGKNWRKSSKITDQLNLDEFQ